MTYSIPQPIRAFRTALMTPTEVKTSLTADFVYDFHSDDRSFTTTQYLTAGTWAGTTTPWLADLAAIPSDWQWSAQDSADQAVRGEQLDKQLHAMQASTDTSGSTADQITRRYTGGSDYGMWSRDVFPDAQLDSLSVWIDDDAEFARQRLGGANTNVIASASAFDVDTWINSARNGSDLDALKSALLSAQAAGNLYICDYRPVLGSVISKGYVQRNRHLAAPIALFQVDGDDRLMPMAIQIEGTAPDSYIFTPGDANDGNGDAWLLAKLWTANADMSWWFSGSHLYNTHSIDMIFGIAALNQMKADTPLDSDHPMLVLAQPHLVKSFNINNAVYNNSYDSTTQSGGDPGIYQLQQFCDQVLATGRIGIYETINNLYENYRFDDAAFDVDMANRGLTTGGLANVSFPYRDDGAIWFDAIKTFVTSVVNATYSDDAAVAADASFNAWMTLVETAFNTNQAANARFTWTPTKTATISTFTNLLFICSVQHTSVNNSMFNGWAFTPNGPFAMQAAPPSDAASVTQSVVLDSLPDPTKDGDDGSVEGQPATDMALIQNQVSFVMNGTAVVSEIIAASDLHAVYPYTEGSAQYQAVSDFSAALTDGDDSVASQITANQQKRITAYTTAPLPNSVSYYYLTVSDVAADMYLNAAATRAIQI